MCSVHSAVLSCFVWFWGKTQGRESSGKLKYHSSNLRTTFWSIRQRNSCLIKHQERWNKTAKIITSFPCGLYQIRCLCLEKGLQTQIYLHVSLATASSRALSWQVEDEGRDFRQGAQIILYLYTQSHRSCNSYFIEMFLEGEGFYSLSSS